jgi:ubiquinone/menaquinone biosynthesis C-methylase UbiE
MIEECRRRYGDIDFAVSNGESLPFDFDSFDLLTICCVLHHLNDPQKFFEEAQRVLKPDGILIVGDPWFPFGVRQIFDWVVSPLIKSGDNKIFSHKRLKELFIGNGFSIMELYKKGSIQIIKGRKA